MKFTEIPIYILEDFFNIFKEEQNQVIMGPVIVAEEFTDFSFVIKTDKKYETFRGKSSSGFTSSEKQVKIEILDGNIDNIENGFEVYFKKDSELYFYLKNYTDLYSFINTNKDFLYLGKIYYFKDNEYVIVVDSLYYFVINSIPENNRTENLQTFLKIAFDKVYTEIYNKQKNLLSLHDVLEVDNRYLDLFASQYNIILNEDYKQIYEQRTRWFLNNINDYLKRKGTYSSIYIIANLVLYNTTNLIKIYERWHDEFDWEADPNPINHFTDINYLNYYSKAVSSTENGWELIDIPVGGGGSIINDNCSVHNQLIESTNWKIFNKFKTKNVILQFYDSDYNWIEPVNIEFSDDIINIYWGSLEAKGFCFILLNDDNFDLIGTSDIYTYIHNLNGYVLSEFKEDNYTISFDKEIYKDSDSIILNKNDNITSSSVVKADYFYDNKIHSKNWNITDDNISKESVIQVYIRIPKKEITIYHNLDTVNIIINTYDKLKEIKPELIEILDNNSIKIYFSTYFSGWVNISTSDETIEQTENILWNINTLIDFPLIQNFNDTNISLNDSIIYKIGDNFQVYWNQPEIGSSQIINPDVTYEYDNKKIINITHNLNSYKLLAEVYGYYLSNTWLITHNLNSTNVYVQIYSNDNQLIHYESIEIIDENQIEIIFDREYSGYCLIKDMNYEYSITSDLYQTIPLSGFNDKIVNTNYYNNFVFNPLEIEIDDNNFNILYSESKSGGKILLDVCDFFYNINTSSNEWYIPHELNTKNLIVETYSRAYWATGENWIIDLIDNELPLINSYYDWGSISTNDELVTIKQKSTNDIYNISFINDTVGRSFIKEGEKSDNYGNTWIFDYDDFNLTTDPLLSFYNLENELIEANSIIYDTGSRSVSATFSESVSGYAVGCEYDLKEYLNGGIEHTITHNLSTDSLIISCIKDSSNSSIKPKDIEIIDENNIKLTFDESFFGDILIAIGESYYTRYPLTNWEILDNNNYSIINVVETPPVAEISFTGESPSKGLINYMSGGSEFSFTDETIWVSNDLLNEKLLIQCYDSNNNKIDPDEIIIDTLTFSASAVFPENTSGKIIINNGYKRSFTDITSYTWTHNYNTYNVIVQVYDTNGNQIDADNIEILDSNTIRVSFNSSTSGFIVLGIGDSYNIKYMEYLTEDKDIWKLYPETSFYSAIVQVYDNSYTLIDADNTNIYSDNTVKYIIPNNITIQKNIDYEKTSANIQWDSEKTGYISLNYSDISKTNHTLDYFWESECFFNDRAIIQTYNKNNEIIYPDYIEYFDNIIRVAFSELKTGVLLLKESNYTFNQNTPSIVWTINHNKNMDSCNFTIYDENNNIINPEYLKIIDNNTIEIKFLTAQTGRAELFLSVASIRKIYPDNIHHIDENNTKIEFGTKVSGLAVMSKALKFQSYEILQDYDLSILDNNNIEIELNNFNSGVISLKSSDFSGEYLEKASPKSITHNNNNINIDFDEEVSGILLLKNVAQDSYIDKLIMSPHYLVELDLSFYPYGENFIIDKLLSYELYSKWEETRPVNRYSHYLLSINPKCYFSEDIINLYNDYNASFNTYIVPKLYEYKEDSRVYINLNNEKIWNINHDLNYLINTQFFNYETNEVIHPKKIWYKDYNNLIVEFNNNIKGYALISRADGFFTQTYMPSSNTLSYQLSGDNVINLIGQGDTEIIPDSQYYSETGDVIIELDVPRKPDLVFSSSYKILQNAPSKTWTIVHNFNVSGIISEFYDNLGNKIIPNSIKILDDNTIFAEFSNKISGVCRLKPINNILNQDMIISNLEGGYVKFGNGSDLNNFYPQKINNIKNTIVIKDLVLEDLTNSVNIISTFDDKIETDITEVGIFDKYDNIIFYSYFDTIYKLDNVDFKYKLTVYKD